MTAYTVATIARAESATVHIAVAVACVEAEIACIEVSTVHIETTTAYMRNFESSTQPLKRRKVLSHLLLCEQLK